MSKLDDDITEIDDFLKSLRFSGAINLSEHNKVLFKSAYKQFHALLVWGVIAENLPNSQSLVKIYFREMLSDISQSFFLTLTHLYKPARTSLRSGVENFIRSLLFIRDVDASGIGSVYELFEVATKLFIDDDSMLKNIQQLNNAYAELCKTVHSVKTDYMSLSVPFERLCVFQSGRYGTNISGIRAVASAENQAMFALWSRELQRVGHENEDMVRDALPRALKRSVGERL